MFGHEECFRVLFHAEGGGGMFFEPLGHLDGLQRFHKKYVSKLKTQPIYIIHVHCEKVPLSTLLNNLRVACVDYGKER